MRERGDITGWGGGEKPVAALPAARFSRRADRTLWRSSLLVAAVFFLYAGAGLSAKGEAIQWDPLGDVSGRLDNTSGALGSASTAAGWWSEAATGNVASNNTDVAYSGTSVPVAPARTSQSLQILDMVFNPEAADSYTFQSGLIEVGTLGLTVGNASDIINLAVGMKAAASWTSGSGRVLTPGGAIANGGYLLASAGTGSVFAFGVMADGGGLARLGGGTAVLSTMNSHRAAPSVQDSLPLATVAAGGSSGGGGWSGLGAVAKEAARNPVVPLLPSMDPAVGSLPVAGGEGPIVINSGDTFSLSGSGLTQRYATLTNHGGTFYTGTNNTMVGTGASVYWLSGSTNTIGSDSTVSDQHWVIVGGTNTVNEGGTLEVLSGSTVPVGLYFSGTGSPALTLQSSTGTAGSILLKQDVTVDATLTGTAQILNSGTAANAGFIDLNGVTRTFTVNDGGAATDLLVSAKIQDGGLTKAGAGTLTLSGVNAYTGTTTVSAGTLKLDYGTNASNIIASSSPLTMAGGTLSLLGKNSGATSQTLAATAVSVGGSTITVDGNGGTGTTLTLGAITATTAGGTLNIATIRTGTVTTTTNHDSTGIYGGRITFNGSDWATTTSIASPYVLSAYSGYTALAATASPDTVNSRITASATLSGSRTTNTLKIENPVAGQTLSLNTRRLTLTAGGLLVTGSNAFAISGTAAPGIRVGNGSGAYDLIIHQYNSGGLTISAIIGDTSGGNPTSLTKTGPGTLTLSGTNTYTGATTISEGTLAYGVTNAIAGGAVTVHGGTLDIGTYNDTVGAVTLAGGSIIGTTGVLTGGSYAVESGSISAILGGAGGLTKTTNGTAIISGTNSYTGATTISVGVLNIQNAAALGTTAAGTTVAAGAALQLQGGLTVGAEALTLNGTGVSNDGALRNISGANSYGGLLTLGSAARINSDTAGDTLTLSNTGIITGAGFGLTVGGAGNATINSIIGTTSGTLTKDGTGTLTLAAASTYTGATTVSAGTLALGVGSAVPGGSDLVLGGTDTVGTLKLGAYATTVKSLSFGTGGGTLRLAANQTASAQLSASGSVALGTTNSLDLTGMSTAAGLYRLVSGSSLSGTFGTVTGLDGSYTLKYGTVNANEVDAQHKAVIGTISATPAAAFIITGGSTSFTFTVANAAPVNSASLAFSAVAGANTTGSVGGPASAVAGAASGATAGLTFTGTATGANQAGVFTVNDPNSTNSGQSGSVLVNVYGHAAPGAVSGGTLTLGSIHAGYTGAVFSSNSGAVTNGAAGDYRVALKGSGTQAGGTTAGLTLNAISGITTGNSGTIGASLAPGLAAGAINQNFTYTFADDSLLSGASANVGTATLTVTGQVYSGRMIWSGASGGGWGAGGNWHDSVSASIHAAPGLDAGFTGVDSATFGNSSGSVTVNLNGAAPSLNSLVFTSTGNYTITQGSGGSLTLAGSAPGITVSGTHTISAPVTLASALAVAVAGPGDSLTVSGVISSSGAGVTKTGAGTLTFSGTNSYTGATTISAGVLNIHNAAALGTTAAGTTVAAGAALQLQGGITVGAEALTLTGAGVSNDGALRSVSGANSYGGLLTLGGTARINSDTAGDTLTLSNTGIITGAGFGLTVGGAGNATINSIIGTTSGTLTKDGTGTLTLAGVNTFTGTLAVQAGTLAVNTINNSGTAGTLGSNTNAVALGSSGKTGTLQYTGATAASSKKFTLATGGTGAIDVTTAGTTLTLSGLIDGQGGLVKLGVGELTLSSTNSYSGGTLLSAGVLNINNAAALGLGAFTIAGGTINNSSGAALTLANSMNWNSDFTFVGTNNLTFGSDVVTLGGNRQVTVTANTLTIGGEILGGYGLAKAGAGTLVLGGDNSYTGTTTVSAGVLRIQYATGLGTTVAGTTVAAGAALEIAGGIAVGAEALGLSGTGTGTATGALRNSSGVNSYNGAITLNAASRINSDADLLLLTGGITNGGSQLTVGGAGGTTISGAISGAGGLTKDGTGTLVLNGSNGYTGATTLSNGKLYVNGSLNGASAVAVANGDTFGGAGSAGAATAAAGGVIEAGYLGVGALTLSSLAFNGTGVINLTPNGASPLTAPLQVTSALTATTGSNVTINLSALPVPPAAAGFAATYRLVDYGSVTNPGLFVLGTTIGSARTAAYTLSNNTGATALDLSLTINPLIWTGALSNVWSTATLAAPKNWKIGAATTDYVNGDIVLFDDTATGTTTANLSATNVTAGAVLFTNSTKNYTLQGTYAITGGGGLAKSGSGTLTILNNNNYTGVTTIGGGTLQVGNGGTTGTLGTGNIVDNAALVFNRGDALAAPLTVGNSISGSGSLALTGTGVLALSGNNSYAGDTTVNAGATLRLGASNVLPSGTGKGNLVLNGVLDMWGSNLTLNGLSGSGTITDYTQLTVPDPLTDVTLTVGGNNASSTFSGVIQNGGLATANAPATANALVAVSLVKTGTGTLTLTGNNPYTGATTIQQGTLQVGNGGTTGTIGSFGDITNNGALLFNRSNNQVVTARIGGSGSLTQMGTGTLTLANVNSYTGGTTVSAGTLVSRSSASLGSGAVTLGNNTKLALGGNLDFAGFNNGVGWSSNAADKSNPAHFTDGLLTITDNPGNEANSVFRTSKVDVSSGFTVNFAYLTRGQPTLQMADGIVFTLQNDTRGTAAIGDNGGVLAYGTKPGNTPVIPVIANSVGIMLDTHYHGDPNVVSANYHGRTALLINGATEDANDANYNNSPYVNTALGETSNTWSGSNSVYDINTQGAVALDVFHPIMVRLVYDNINKKLVETLVDTATGQTKVWHYNIDIPAIVGGNSAYMGFTGATGAMISTQNINAFWSGLDTGSYANTINVLPGATASIEMSVPTVNVAGLQMGAGAGMTVTPGTDLGPTTASSPPFILSASQTTLSGTNSFNVANNGTGTGTLALSSVGGSGGLVKTGSGVLALPTANNFTGNTQIASGTLLLGNSLALQNSTLNLAATNSGTLSFGNLTDVTLGGLTGSGALALTNTAGAAVALDVGGNGQNTTYSGLLTGNGSLTKTGTGSLTLTGSNSYTGATILDGGTLFVTGSGSLNGTGGITVDNGAVFNYNSATPLTQAVNILAGTVVSPGSSGTLPMDNLNSNGASAINVMANVTSPLSPAITVTTPGGIAATGATTINLLNQTALAAGTTYRLIDYSGTIGGDGFSAYSLGEHPADAGTGAHLLYNLVNNTLDTAIDLGVTRDVLVWTGLADGGARKVEWSTGAIPGSQNWRLASDSSRVDFRTDDTVLFDDTATGTTTVNISVADVNPYAVTFANDTLAYTLTGSHGITGAATLLKTGTGLLTITNTNSYSGGTQLDAGTLDIAGVIGGGTTSVNSGATLTGSGKVSGLSVNSGGTLAPGTGVGTLTANGNTTFNGGGVYTWDFNRVTPADGMQTAHTGAWFDTLNIGGTLTLNATLANKFIIDLATLDPLNGTPGQVQDWNPNGRYSWNIATAVGGISGFNANAFSIITKNFQNTLTMDSRFYVSMVGDSLFLNYVPEPGTMSLLLIGALALLGRRRNRR